MGRSASGRLIDDDPKTRNPKPRLPLPDEPYWPSAPPRKPQTWSQERWDAWWSAIARCCAYHMKMLNETIPPLAPPPRIGAPAEAWSVWWNALESWDIPFTPDAEVEWPEFPPGWLNVEANSTQGCVLCKQRRDSGFMRRCPKCGSDVCRECLFLSQDVCPVDGFRNK